MPSMAAFGGNESCPNCSAPMAADQRYCLNCGHRRGDPRLPFMDAVVFMESQGSAGGAGSATPPPPPASSRGGSERWNPNATLVAVVAVLVLAMGVGFLIGHNSNNNSSQAQGPQIIKVEGGGGGGGTEEAGTIETPEETEATTGGSGNEAKPGKGGSKSGAKKSTTETSKIPENSAKEKQVAKEKAEEVTHAVVPQAEPGTQVGQSCEKGTAGCGKSGKFEGEFFE
jgi:hypothetical protein